MESSAKPNDATAAKTGEWAQAASSLIALMDSRIPPQLLNDPESARRARLMVRFSVLGSLFGVTYATFYLLIGHHWGALIILLCTAGVAVSPFLMNWKGTIGLAGDFFSFILTVGFLGLCFVEGGVHGHAIAWLVSVPLCSLLLTGRKAAIKWIVISFLAAALVVGVDLAGIELPVAYDPRWTPLVSAAGYLGLVVFMFILGLIFENGRAAAHARMQTALAQLAANNTQLIAANLEKNEFLGIAAHDLKNPLTVVLGNAELLKVIDDPDQSKSLAEMIVSAAERMRQLITNLLDVNAIEGGKFASRLDCCDMGQLVRQSVEHNLDAATQKDIEIRVGVSEEIYAMADATATIQILDNLISNAVKYTPLNSTVYVHLTPETEHALVMVRDEGPGISEADQKKLFQKFGRLSACPTGGESSTGLGLVIARKLAHMMKGTVECHSTVGFGATFTLRLPLWSEKTIRAAPAAQVVVQVPVPKSPSYYSRN